MTQIIVGVDGSESSENALRWALEEAELRQVERVMVVHAYRPPEFRNYGAYADAFLAVDAVQGRADADRARREEEETYTRQAAERLLERLVGDARTGAISADLELLALPNDPAKTMIDMSRDADLLVVGSRGRGGFKGLLLGSVSQQCLQHSHCPVVVVR